MGFTIPNYTDAVTNKEVGDQAEPDSVDFQILGNPAYGVVNDSTNFSTNGSVTATGTISNNIVVAPYKVLINGVYYVNTLSTTVSAGEGTSSPRFDLVVIRASSPTASSPVVIPGEPNSSNPEFPAITSSDVVLAAIYRSGVGVTGYIDSSHIVDKRLFLNSNQVWVKGFSPVTNTDGSATSAAVGDLWMDTSATNTGQTMLWIKQSASSWRNISSYIVPSTTNTPNSLVLRDGSGNFNATSASSVAWNNISGVPTDFVRNNSGTYNISINGSAGYANSAGSAGSATSATNATNATNAINANQLVEGPFYIDWQLNGWYTYGDLLVGSKMYYFYPTGGSASTQYLVVTDSGEVKTRTGTSLRGHKNDISDITGALETVNKLRPRNFTFKPDYIDMQDPQSVYDLQTQTQYGLVVEEVLEVNPELVHHKISSGNPVPYMWKDNAIISLLVGAVKELTERIETLEKKKK
jgi:hypothetical protein